MFAAAAAWLREATALTLPLFAFRNVKLIQSMSASLPCNVAAALWQPPMIYSSPTPSSSATLAFKMKWLRHLQLFTLLQHAPMFVGAHFYLVVTSDDGGSGRVSNDELLYKPIAEIARQAAVAGATASVVWCGVDYVWPKLRATDEVVFEAL